MNCFLVISMLVFSSRAAILPNGANNYVLVKNDVNELENTNESQGNAFDCKSDCTVSSDGADTAKCNACASGQTLDEYCNDQENYVEGCFEYTISLLFKNNTSCKEPAYTNSGWLAFKQTLRKPVGVCTTNVVGNTVIFKCDSEQGKIIEQVYHDGLDGSKCEGAQCTCESEILYNVSIKNGCTETAFGGVHMVWDNFCLAPNANPEDLSETPLDMPEECEEEKETTE